MPRLLLSLVGLLQSSPLGYVCSFFPLVLVVSVGVKWVAPFLPSGLSTTTAVDSSSQSTISSPRRLCSLSLANTWISPWSAMDHTSFSLGRKLLSQEKKHTHMNKKLERKEPWRKVKANYRQKNPTNGSWENSQSGDLLPVPQ